MVMANKGFGFRNKGRKGIGGRTVKRAGKGVAKAKKVKSTFGFASYGTQ